MANRSRRDCPICGQPNLLKLSNHLSQFHGLSSDERQRWLQRASYHPSPVAVEQYLPPSSDVVVPRPLSPVDSLDTQPHPDFVFQHPYSMMVVGPSQCGKTHFVHQLLTHKCTVYPRKRPWRVVWCYNQWQSQYEAIQRDLGSHIRFMQGLPELGDDLSSIPTSKHTIIVLDDLMAQATDSPLVSKLFTQGRHRNASVILLLQNMFPKGKYNTDISRNATYKVLFRSPGDRKQIDIMAEQTFAKDRPRFMQAYSQETERPYGYIVVDNHPRTASEHQVVGDVLGDCYAYPHITSTSPLSQTKIDPVPLPEKPVTRKRPAPVTHQSSIKKRKTNNGRVRKAEKRKRVSTKKRKSTSGLRKVQAAKKRKVDLKRGPTKKRKSKSALRKQPVHDSTLEEEDVPEEEEDPASEDSEQGVDLLDNEGAPRESFHEQLLRIAASSRNGT